jgi:hypothetical protein
MKNNIVINDAHSFQELRKRRLLEKEDVEKRFLKQCEYENKIREEMDKEKNWERVAK